MAKDRAPQAGGPNVLIMGASIILIAALMGWLFMQQQNRAEATVATGDSAAAAPVASGAPPAHVVSDSVFEQNVKTYVGQVVEITGIAYSSGLSPQTFWVDLPSGMPFLVKLDDALVAAGTALPTSGRVTIVGTVQSKDEATVAQWLQSGVLQDDNQRQQAEFGTTYIEARQVRPAGQ